MQDRAKIVIIGGGAVGCAIAYHLAQRGEKDVLVLEKSLVTHGATWHAAGLIGQLRSKRNLTKMMQNSVALCERLAGETGQETGWHQVGSLRVASSADHWQEIKRTATTARSFGFDLELLSAKEAQDKFPYMSTKGVLGAAFIPTDGYIDPYSYTMALVAGARAGGVKFEQNVLVEDIIVENNRVTGVRTDKGHVDCDILVNAAGLWARQVGMLAGVSIPTTVVEHQYCVTEKSKNIPTDLPTIRDPHNLFYLKPEVGGFVIGGWEEGTTHVDKNRLPFEFGRELYEGNFDRFENVLLPAAERLPILNELGIQTMINGPIPVSADGEPILGPLPQQSNHFIACGFTAGIAGSGGAGEIMANWILDGDPGMDIWAFDVRRFGPHQASSGYLEQRSVEVYSHYYKVHFPALEMETARNGRRSPLHKTLAKNGACYGSKSGWERPNFFWPDGMERLDIPSFDRSGWNKTVGVEHHAIRNGVALIDQSSFSKFEVSGKGAAAFLQKLAVNDVDKQPGTATYTQLCNEKGGIEADLTIIRETENRFYVVTGSGFGVRDRHWIESNMSGDDNVHLSDITSSRAVINLCGPLARQVLEKSSEDDVSNDSFPFWAARWIHIGMAPILAIRLTYVGELGWELHIPVEYALYVYERLKQAGEQHNIIDAGYRAIDSLRMEKRYLYWGADIGPDYTPLEAGLGFCIKFNKGDFIGKEALLRQKEQGVSRKLSCFLLDQNAHLHGSEAIYHQGKIVGLTTSGNFGYTVNKSIAFGYLPAEIAAEAEFEIEAYTKRHSAKRVDGCAYDPHRKNIMI